MLLENAKDYLRRAGFRLIRETDDETLMFEGKSRQKGDKFAHKERVANKKQKCCGGKCGKNCCEDDDDDLDESYLDEGILQSIKDRWQDRKVLKRGEKHDKWLKQNAHKAYHYNDGSVENVRNMLKAVRGLKCTEEDIAKAKKLNIEDLNDVLNDIDLEQAPGYGIYNDGSKFWWENNPKCKYISDILRFVLQKELDDEVKTHGAEIDESTNSFINELKKVLIDRGYNEEGASSWIFVHKNKIADLEESGYSAEDVVYELDGSLDEAIEDVPGLTREPRGQVGTDDWSDFKDNFRAKTLLLKQVLTPKFVSELIKRTDFSVDEKEIKDYAISVIENANLNAQNPVKALQRKISRHFTGV